MHNPKIQVVDDEVGGGWPTKAHRATCFVEGLRHPADHRCTTVEMLAEMLAGQLRRKLREGGAKGLTAIEMEVEENIGQAAVYRVSLRRPAGGRRQ